MKKRRHLLDLGLVFIILGVIVVGYTGQVPVKATTWKNMTVKNQRKFKAPLYWSVYEFHYLREKNPNKQNYIPEKELMKNIKWVENNLKEYGYDMIAIDGWGDVSVSNINKNGYRTSHSHHWKHDYEWWSNYLKKRDMRLGMYENPLWVHDEAIEKGATIKGTSISVTTIVDEGSDSTWFNWVEVDKPGAEKYVKGYVRHFGEMGIKFLNIDFLSWYEDGYDKNLGDVGSARSVEDYKTALRWINEAAAEYDMLIKAVMPSLNNEANLERKYAHMIRINEDIAEGGWKQFSGLDRGNRRDYWSQWANPMDGYAYWSYIADQIILCGDFIRLNTFDTAAEKKSVISQHLLAGGPLGVADQYDTISDNLKYYQNEEMLALNKDGFIGQPLSNDPTNKKSQIWWGRMSNGDFIIGLFNREARPQVRSVDFNKVLGITGKAAEVRDLWEHKNLGAMSEYRESIPPHGVTVLRIKP